MIIPELRVPKSKVAQKDWAEEIHNGIDKYYSAYFSDMRNKDFENYNLFNGIVSKEQFSYVTDTYNNTNPARFVHYPIMKKMIELLVGEWLSSPLHLNCELVNDDAVNRKFDKKVSLVFESLIRPYRQELEKEAGIKIGEDTMGMEIPDNIDEFMHNNFRENTEDVVVNGLKYLIHKYNLKDVFKRGLYDYAVTSKQFYKLDIVNGDPIPRRVDPRNIIYDIHTDVEDLSKSEWVAEQRYMTVSEIMHEFRHDLSKSDRDALMELRKSTEQGMGNAFDDVYHWFKFYDSNLTHIRVVTAEWRAIKEVKVKVSENKYNPNKPFYKFLPDDYKAKKNDKIEKVEVVEVWTATRIGPELLIRVQPSDLVVTREEWGYQEMPLSFVGSVMHNIDGHTISMVDLMKQIQILYDITMFNIELVMQRSAGKAVFYDVAQKPAGLDLDDVIYQARNHGFVWINSAQEGNQLKSSFNQFQSVDFTMSNSLTQLINLKMMLEQTIQSITGLNEARIGQMKDDAAVGTSESKIQQSSYITQSFYHNHSALMEKVFTRMSDLMKIAWAGRKKYNFPLGEEGSLWLELLAKEDVSMNDYAIFIKNSVKDQRNRSSILQLSEAALRGGQIGFLDIVKILNSDTSKEAERILERSIEATQKAQQEAQQQQMEAQQAAMQQKSQEQQMKYQSGKDQASSRIEAARIAAQGKIEAEKVEQSGKREYEDHKFTRAIDEAAYQQSMAGGDEPVGGLVELSKEKLMK